MADSDTTDPDVEAWRCAFVAANGREPDQLPQYEKGWFVFRSSLGWVTSRCRRAQLWGMTHRLQERVNV